jgi:tRNA(Ile)-lysidine synthase
MQEKTNFKKKFELKVRRFIRDEGLLTKDDRCVVAVSGGADSLCLLLLLSQWAKREGWDLKVAYFDHRLRESADHEKVFVQNWSQKLGFPFVSGEADCGTIQKEQKLSMEEAARQERYRFLKKEAEIFGFFVNGVNGVNRVNRQKTVKIATGHHLDDQVETFFVNLIKGSGLSGLSGMKPKTAQKNECLIRPLLAVTKQEILDYLQHQNIRYCVDETNDDCWNGHILRNRVRQRLIPFLKKEFQWNLFKSLPRMMKVLASENQFLKAIEKEWGERHIHWQKKGASIRVCDFKNLDAALQRRVIKRVLDRFSPRRNYSSRHIEENRKLFFNTVSNKKIILPEGIVASRTKEEIRWQKNGAL